MLHNLSAPKTTYLKDYTPSAYLVNTIELIVELNEDFTLVHSTLKLYRNPLREDATQSLILFGQQLELVNITLNKRELSKDEYSIDTEQLVIQQVPAEFVLEITTKIKPQENTALSGLYKADGIFCTQCEAEGFRRITYYLDRPDVLARFTTTIIADKNRYPVLLSNGNPISKKDLSHNRHQITWHDPFKKPSYLFALVAGDLECLEDHYITASGREVLLQIFTDKGQIDKCDHAMQSVKKAMRWDEHAYGREYDLDIFMIVAIQSFNMGAMENKGLNIFNAKYILAKPETATDADYEGIMSVVGHEYFHNWTGDRVTCRDWFQLSLKEGLTVFREQEFTADMTSPLVSLIDNVKMLRNVQFKEDAGPLAHSVQPDAYIEINNFYTATIYEKGAEIIRMLKNLIGAKSFRQGMDIYFERHDGQAATIEDFIKAMEDASQHDLTQFRRWYHQAGTPQLTIDYDYLPAEKLFKLSVTQHCPPTPGQPEKLPVQLPLTIGLLDSQGQDMPLQLKGEAQAVATTRTLEIKNKTEIVEFENIQEQPLPSILRNFSAPVKLNINYSNNDLAFLFKYDSDGFNRWEAGQQLICRFIFQMMKDKKTDLTLLTTAYKYLFEHQPDDKAYLAELLTLPSEAYLGEQMQEIDVEGIHINRKQLRQLLAHDLRHDLLSIYKHCSNGKPYHHDQASIGQRRLKNSCLSYLMLLNEAAITELCLEQFLNADNMTDVMAALTAFVNTSCLEREQVLAGFYQKWQHEPLVVEKWLAVQAASELPGTLQHVKELLNHPAFDIKNPNKVRSLIGTFCQNQSQFHARDGSGYEFLADQVIALNTINPQIAARLLTPLTSWRRYDQQRQQLQKAQLERIIETSGISKDVFEIASKSLQG